MNDEQREDIIRVMRIVEYVGPRSAVEMQVANSIHGMKTVSSLQLEHQGLGARHITREFTIRATTLGTFPEILEAAVLVQALEGKPTEKDLRIAELEKELKTAAQALRNMLPQQGLYANTQANMASNAAWLQNAYGAQPVSQAMHQQQIAEAARTFSSPSRAAVAIEKIKSSFGL